MRVRNDSFSRTMVYRSRGKLLARAVAVLLVAALAAELFRVVVAAETGSSAAPDFVLRDPSGRNVRLSEYRGQVVALAFEAAWCGDCAAAEAALARLQGTLGSHGLQVLAVSFGAADPGGAGGERPFPYLRDPEGEVGKLYSVNKLPSIVLIGREGELVARQNGFRSADEKALGERLLAMLAD